MQLALIVLGGASVVGCDANATADAGPPRPPEVAVVKVAAEDVPLYREFPAQTYARDMVEVRGRVDGYIEERRFDIGSDVKAGQVLYVLDRRPYEAEVERARGDLAQARADLTEAEANLVKATQDVERLEPLVEQDAAPREDLDNARAALEASEAHINSKKATVEASAARLRTAELNLGYATIRAPISGRIGDSLLQVGGLVTAASAKPLTTIVPLDTIWVRFQVSGTQIAMVQGVDAEPRPMTLVLPNGTDYPHEGRITNTLNEVNRQTATLEVQAQVPNPDHLLLPGQYGRVRVQVDERQNALLVPQKAVQQLQGLHSVMTIGKDNVVQVRPVVTGDRVGSRWIIEQGLEPGDTVIVEGVQKARPGAPVSPTPYVAPTAANRAQVKEE